MKKILITCIILMSLSAMGQNQKTYQLQSEKSQLEWKGTYLFKFAEHNGTVNFKRGKLYTKDNAITGGSFIIDMTSITNEEHRLDKHNGPVEHLKNSDFFDVEVYPEASLELTKVTYYRNTNEHRFEGNLTIKGVSKPIMIKAMVDDSKKTIKTKFKIDRRDWGINYTNKFKNDAISDAIEFDVTLQF